MTQPLNEKLEAAFDGVRVDTPSKDRIAVHVQKETLLSVLSFLKKNGYNHLGLISCVDWIDEEAFEMVYILSAYLKDEGTAAQNGNINVILKTRISRLKAAIASVIPVFENAEPYEREIHELYGIHFEGHPRLTPLFLEREYEIPPFRKDFDTRQYVKDFFDTIPAIENKTGRS